MYTLLRPTFILKPFKLQSAGAGSSVLPKEPTKMQKEFLRVLEENNLLKFKVELLLDMLAASSADNYVLQQELNALKKSTKQR